MGVRVCVRAGMHTHAHGRACVVCGCVCVRAWLTHLNEFKSHQVVFVRFVSSDNLHRLTKIPLHAAPPHLLPLLTSLTGCCSSSSSVPRSACSDGDGVLALGVLPPGPPGGVLIFALAPPISWGPVTDASRGLPGDPTKFVCSVWPPFWMKSLWVSNEEPFSAPRPTLAEEVVPFEEAARPSAECQRTVFHRLRTREQSDFF